MNQRKRQGSITTDDSDHDQTNKIQRTSYSKITSFEDLSNELMYDIFDYLDTYHVYQGFINLNSQFQNLLLSFDASLKIHFSNFTRLQFQHYYNNFIQPMKHRIKALHISDPLIFDHFFLAPENIVSYSQLQALFFYKIELKNLENLLKHSALSLKLSSLTIHLDKSTQRTNILILILNLPVLKYFKLLFKSQYTRVSLPISINISSPIEYLIIDAEFDLNQINILLSYAPKLRCSSIKTQLPTTVKPLLVNTSL